MFLALRRGRLLGGDLPPVHARVLQGPALPRLRLGDSRPGRRAGHAPHGRAEGQDPDHALDHVHRLRWPSPAFRAWPASSPRTRFCGRPTARRWGSKPLYVVGLVTAGMTAFYMWRLMNMTFYGKSRVDAGSGGAHPRIAALDDRAADRCWRPAACSPAGSACPSCGTCPESFRGLRALAGAGVRLRRGRSAPRRRARSTSHRVDADVPLGGGRAWSASGWPGTSISDRPEIPGLASKRASSRFIRLLYNKWYVDEIYDFLFVNGLCKGGGRALRRLRPQRGGWRRERRRLADALHLHGLHLVGHLDRRRRGALQLLLREDALLPGAHPADRPGAGLRAVFVVIGVLAFFGYYVAR